MVLPYIQGGSVESAMKYAYPKVWLLLYSMYTLDSAKIHKNPIS